MAKTGFWLRGAKGKLAGAALQTAGRAYGAMKEILYFYFPFR